MKTILSLLCLLVVTVTGFTAEPVIEFRGVMEGVGPTKLSLRDKAGDNTRWVEIGQSFAGFKIIAYDATIETATLSKDGKELRLRLNSSQVVDAPATTSGGAAIKLTVPVVRAIFNNLRQIAAAADQYFLETGRRSVPLAELVGPTRYIKQLVPIVGEDYSGLRLAQGEAILSVPIPSGEIVTFDPSGRNSSLYLVQAGDTLNQIAQKTGSPPAQLMELNGINDPTALKVGQALRIK